MCTDRVWIRTLKATEALEKSFAADGQVADVTNFDFPSNLTTEKFIASLSDMASIELVSRQYFLKTYYDSFDWRLYKNGITCEVNRSEAAFTLLLRNLENGLIIASTEIEKVPAFSEQFQYLKNLRRKNQASLIKNWPLNNWQIEDYGKIMHVFCRRAMLLANIHLLKFSMN